MKIIKLDAIDSTNDFLKGMCSKHVVENFTVVTAESQTNGKGQMGSKWESESGKNLLMSVLINNLVVDSSSIFDINIIVSVAIVQALEALEIPEIKIKWPNDIMSYSKKIGGILIENVVKSDGSINSIIGLGLNVNQIQFNDLQKASSLALVCNRLFDKEIILKQIVSVLERNVGMSEKNMLLYRTFFTEKLFKKAIPAAFVNGNNEIFMGIIKGVTAIGKLQIEQEDCSIIEYNIKEIQLLY